MRFTEADLAVMLRGAVKVLAVAGRRVVAGRETTQRIRPIAAPKKPAKIAYPVYSPMNELCDQLHALGLPIPMREFRFHPKRRWRADACWPEYMLMLEIDGGVWTQGRHTRGAGFIRDQEKRNEATLMGFRVLNCVPQDVKAGRALKLIERAMR